MKEEINIPYELVLLYANVTKPNYTTIFPVVVDKKSLTNKKRKKIIESIIEDKNYRYCNDSIEMTEDDICEVIISNTSFHIYLDNSNQDSIGANVLELFNDYTPVTSVRISNDELGLKFSKPVYILVSVSSLLKILKDSRYVTDGKIHGDYCMSFNVSGVIDLIQNDSQDKVLEKSKEIGKLINTKTRTSKWKPGYKYAFSPTEYVIYLGNVKFKRYIDTTRNKFRFKTFCVFSDIFAYNYSIGDLVEDDMNLCISSDYINTNPELKDFLETNTLEIEDVIAELLSPKYKDNFGLDGINESSKRGVEIEKCFNVSDNFNLEDFIINFIETNYVSKIDCVKLKKCSRLDLADDPNITVMGINFDYFLSSNQKLRDAVLDRLLFKFHEDLVGEMYSRYHQFNKPVYTASSIIQQCNYYRFPSVHNLKLLKDSFGLTEDKLEELIDSEIKKASGNV